MPLPQFAAVRILSDEHRTKGVPAGSIGRILDVYDDEAYEVEFSRPDGTTIAWFAVPQDEVELVKLPSSLAVERTGV
ncbi:MAG TPA: DUF4926 domain-containing protein [Thermomicrobiales bacterium]|jgi:hypothetical protein